MAAASTTQAAPPAFVRRPPCSSTLGGGAAAATPTTAAAAATSALLAALLLGGGAAFAGAPTTAVAQSHDSDDEEPLGRLLVARRRQRDPDGRSGDAFSQPRFDQPGTAFSFSRPSPAASLCEGAARPPAADPWTSADEDVGASDRLNKESTEAGAATRPAPAELSRWHRILYSLSLRRSLPLPRRVGPNDPDLVLTSAQRRRRRRDERLARGLQQRLVQLVQQRQQLHQSSASAQLAAKQEEELDRQLAHLVQDLYCVLYGDGVTPQGRQEFLERHGCTAWTDRAMDVILERAAGTASSGGRRDTAQHRRPSPRGLVEIGAGHGQWARQIADRHKAWASAAANLSEPSKPFDIVLAYDDGSSLPLNAALYHNRTQPHRDYFYDRVQRCDSIEAVLAQWQCRGRVLLLVYPPPGSDMARDALQSYMSVDGTNNDTLIYVGEGRGGANANAAFFDALESGRWVLEQIVDVRPMGSKGYERMYVFVRAQSPGADESVRDAKHRRQSEVKPNK